MMQTMYIGFIVLCVILLKSSFALQEVTYGYEKEVLTDLCQYNGIKFVRDSDDPACGYMACWKSVSYPVKCPVGTRTGTNFFWSDSFPCTEIDVHNDCNSLKKYLVEQEEQQQRRLEEEKQRRQEFHMWQMLQKHIAEHPQLSHIADHPQLSQPADLSQDEKRKKVDASDPTQYSTADDTHTQDNEAYDLYELENTKRTDTNTKYQDNTLGENDVIDDTPLNGSDQSESAEYDPTLANLSTRGGGSALSYRPYQQNAVIAPATRRTGSPAPPPRHSSSAYTHIIETMN